MYPKFDGNLTEYIEKVELLERYSGNLIYLFLKFAETNLLDKNDIEELGKKFYSENLDFFAYSDIDSAEYLDYCLFVDKKPYEIFSYISVREFFCQNDKIIEKIFSGDLKICLFDNFSKIAILNYTYTIPEKVENILLN